MKPKWCFQNKSKISFLPCQNNGMLARLIILGTSLKVQLSNVM